LNAVIHNLVLTLVYGWALSVVLVALMFVRAPIRRPSAVEQAEAIVRACAAREQVAR
jgi:hypothetical protein